VKVEFNGYNICICDQMFLILVFIFVIEYIRNIRKKYKQCDNIKYEIFELGTKHFVDDYQFKINGLFGYAEFAWTNG